MCCVRSTVRGLLTPTPPISNTAFRGHHWRHSYNTKTQRVVSNASQTATEAEMAELWTTFQQNQKGLPAPTIPELARTLVQNSKAGVLSVISDEPATEGFPLGSLVNYAASEDGKPIFSFTTLASHTRSLQKDARASLLITEDNELTLMDQRVTLTGKIVPVETEIEQLKATFRKKHPDAVYLDFGDFQMFKMEEIMTAAFVKAVQTGSGRTGRIRGEELLAAAPDPVAKFAAPVCRHMNADHSQDNLAMVEVAAGFEVETALLRRVDRLGADFTCTKPGFSPISCRVAFSSPAMTRAELKDRIVECSIQAHEKTNNKYRTKS